MDGNIEDSATAEISRFQVWQWIKHNQELEAHCDTEFSLYGFIKVLEIKTFGLGSRIRDVKVGGLKNHNFLP